MNVRDRVLFHSTLRRSRRDAALDHDVALDFCHAKASLMRKAYRAVIVAFTKAENLCVNRAWFDQPLVPSKHAHEW